MARARASLRLRRSYREFIWGREPSPRRVLRDMARAIDAPWDIAAGGGLTFPGVDGVRNLKVHGNAYIPLLRAAAPHDAELAMAYRRVAGMLDHRRGCFASPGAARHQIRAVVSASAAVNPLSGSIR